MAAEGVGKSFSGREVLRGVTVSVRRGEIVAIVGGSGSGKTVLLHILAGLLSPDVGRVLAADHSSPGAPLRDLSALSESEFDAVRMSWGMVFQKNALFSGTVRENCALILRERGVSEVEIDRRVRAALEAVALDPAGVMGKDRDELSGGMAKRVAIARAIATDPALMLYDEPTTGLDPVISGHIHGLIWREHLRPRSDGSARTTVLVTHDKELLRRIRPRVVMLHGAGVCSDSPYDRFGGGDCPPAAEYLAAMPVLHARPAE